MASIAAEYSPAPVTPATVGTVLVGLVGRELVVKLYPPFLRDHFEFEVAALQRLAGRWECRHRRSWRRESAMAGPIT